MLTIVANVHEIIECVVCACSLALVWFSIADYLEKNLRWLVNRLLCEHHIGR